MRLGSGQSLSHRSGRGEGEGSLKEFQRRCGVGEEVPIRKPNQTHSMTREIAAASLIMAKLVRLVMLAPVEFDTDMHLRAIEVKNVRPDGVLATALEARELP